LPDNGSISIVPTATNTLEIEINLLHRNVNTFPRQLGHNQTVTSETENITLPGGDFDTARLTKITDGQTVSHLIREVSNVRQ
jgi:hypothetical protein